MMVFMISMVKKSIWKGFKSMEQDFESFWLWLKNWIWKCEREDDEMNICYRMIGTYFTTQGIHQEIRNHELSTQGNPPKK